MTGGEAVAADTHRGGQARIGFSCSPDGITFVSDQNVGYPFHVTRPFYFERDPPGMASLYLQSVSGGLYAAEQVTLSITAGENASAHVTTQASTIVHECVEGHARQTVVLNARAHSLLEFLPDSTVLFPGAALDSSIEIVVDDNATVLCCDSFIAHDPQDVGRCFNELDSRLRVRSTRGDVLAFDRFVIDGPRFRDTAGVKAHGSLVLVRTGLDTELFTRLHENLLALEGCYGGVSELPFDAGLWIRVLGSDTSRLRSGLAQLWMSVRQHLFGQTPSPRPK